MESRKRGATWKLRVRLGRFFPPHFLCLQGFPGDCRLVRKAYINPFYEIAVFPRMKCAEERLPGGAFHAQHMT